MCKFLKVKRKRDRDKHILFDHIRRLDFDVEPFSLYSLFRNMLFDVIDNVYIGFQKRSCMWQIKLDDHPFSYKLG